MTIQPLLDIELELGSVSASSSSCCSSIFPMRFVRIAMDELVVCSMTQSAWAFISIAAISQSNLSNLRDVLEEQIADCSISKTVQPTLCYN